MSIFEKSRFKIVSPIQHILQHDVEDLVYSNNYLPSSVDNMEAALDYLFAALYPRSKPSVNTVGDLPAVGNSINDFRIVQDDGDGKAAGYQWLQWDGDAAPEWKKVYDIDWGYDEVVGAMLNKTQGLFVYKNGADDYDETGTIIAGVLAGQSVYGGASSGSNLTLFANNGDLAGNTGYVQFGDDVRPIVDDIFTLGTPTERFSIVYSMEALIDTLSLATGSITDSTGAISFDNENLSTTGTLASGNLTVSADLVLAAGSITSVSGAISFDNENISTTGTLGAGETTVSKINIDDISIDARTISSTAELILSPTTNIEAAKEIKFTNFQATPIIYANTDTDTGLLLKGANQVSLMAGNTEALSVIAGGLVGINKAVPTVALDIIGDAAIVGVLGITGSLVVDNLTLDGTQISSTGSISISPTTTIDVGGNIVPTADDTYDLGTGLLRFSDLFISNSISNGTNAILASEILSLRDVLFRDVGRTQAAQTGDTLFYDSINGVWLASVPDTEITHSTISGLTTGDAGHTQFVMLDGRDGGQIIHGGDSTGELLTLRNNAGDDNGWIVSSGAFYPDTDKTYDIGTALLAIKDIYMYGEGVGLRSENDTLAGINAAASGLTIGRLWYSTDEQALYVDKGGTAARVGHNTYRNTHTDVQLAAGINVSSSITDARNAIWQIHDIAANDEVLGVVITATSTTVTVTASPALPAGNYRLLGVEV